MFELDLSNENIIKAFLIDSLLKRNEAQTLFGNEVIFGSKGRHADLLYLTNNIKAYEIKAQNDDFRNLKLQLSDYKKVFDFLYLIVTENHFTKAKQTVRNNEGLVVITTKLEFEIYKEAKQIKKHNKDEILGTINASFLKDYFHLPTNFSASEARKYLKQKSIEELEKVLFEFLCDKLTAKNSLFFSERGNTTHFEDVGLLSFRDESELF